MKITTVLLLATCLQVSAAGYGQRVSISGQNLTLKKVFTEIQKQSGYSFLYFDKDLEKSKPVTIDARNVELKDVLNQVFREQPLSFTIIEQTIIIREKPVVKSTEDQILEDLRIDISGIVTDEDGSPLNGASIMVKGTTQGTTSDKNGHFALSGVDENSILVISFVGYKSKEVRVNSGRSFSIQLEMAPDPLNETIVIGYGTTTRRKNTGSVSSITSEEISRQPIANPLNALQGRIAGALVTQSNGLPGSRVTIQIRGVNSIDQTGAGLQPLYIVDGVPFNMYDNSVPANNDLNSFGQFAAAGGLSPFSVINPADIERIDVLKDADATAIYGTRGANGVVLITTRKGQVGKTKLDLNVYKGSGKVGHFIPMMNTQQYLQMRSEAFTNDGITPTATNAPDLFVWDQNANTNWQDKYLGGTASITDAQATVSGGDTRTRFLFNTGYHRETPVFPGDYEAERISTRLNVDHNSLDRKFNANVSVNYAFDKTDLLSRDLSTLYNLPPNMPLFNPDGSLLWNANFTNPESYLLVKYFSKTHNLMANSILRYTILPGLDIKTSFGYNNVHLQQNTQNPALSKNPLNGVTTNSATFADIDQKSYILEPQLTFTRNISNGRLSALLGSAFQHALNTYTRLSGDNYSTPSLLNSIAGAGTVGTPSYGYTMYRYNSVFGRINYDWNSKYILNAVVRRDGSSRFGPGKRFGTFWSIGAGWIFTNENFSKSLSFLSFGKLRTSYGVTGNDQIQDYLYRTFFSSTGSYQNGAALYPSRLNNPGLHWQTTHKLEFGLDLAFLDRKIELTANYYRNRTPDQLGYLSLSSQAGFNSYSSNFDALIQNTGFELELHTNNITRKEFTWRTSFNITVPRTKLVNASPDYFFYNENVIGKPLSVVFRYSYQGVDPATGRPLYRNLTNDTLTFTPGFGTDRSVIGFSAPKFYGGLNNVLNLKNFELSFFFQFQSQEGTIRPSATPGLLSQGNQTTFWLDRWTKPGDITSVPRYTTTSSIYSAWGSSNATWGNSSFLRLRTVNISYLFPQTVLNKLKVDNIRIFLQGQNLWWTSKNKYVYDPETGTAMPPLRIVTAGLNVTL